jgi:hypothetical protein
MAEAEQSSAWWRHYQRSWLRSDVVAGLTVRAVLVPESLVYATIAGVSPVVGDGGAVRKRREATNAVVLLAFRDIAALGTFRRDAGPESATKRW